MSWPLSDYKGPRPSDVPTPTTRSVANTPVFHVDLLTPYKEMATYGQNYMRPPPDLINGEEEYEVECIINSRYHGRRRQVQYLVKWKGYPDLDNQWIRWQDVNAPDLIAE